MNDCGFSECKSAAEVMEVLERLNVEQISMLISLYKCSGSSLATTIMKGLGLRDSQIAGAKKNEEAECRKAEIAHAASTLYLAEKYLAEKIRSDKVIEGVLKDICNGVERIADSFEWQNKNLN